MDGKLQQRNNKPFPSNEVLGNQLHQYGVTALLLAISETMKTWLCEV
jgi:hypothetical protein